MFDHFAELALKELNESFHYSKIRSARITYSFNSCTYITFVKQMNKTETEEIPTIEREIKTTQDGRTDFSLHHHHHFSLQFLQLHGSFYQHGTFCLLLGCPTVNLGPLSKGQPHSPDVNHSVFVHFHTKVTEILVTRLGL